MGYIIKRLDINLFVNILSGKKLYIYMYIFYIYVIAYKICQYIIVYNFI